VRVLIGCEFSGTVREAFRELGHDAWSCDLLPDASSVRRPPHIVGDVREVACHAGPWDLAIFHPPCTRLANSGVRWLAERNLWADLDAAADLFRACLTAPIARIAVENPIPHGHAIARIGRKYDQIIHPWQFGHGESKATCLWLKGLPPLTPTDVVAGREQRIWKMGPSPDRWAERSKTYPGIARAMAAQWGAA
jgi:hypothetical protein